eukprot:352965-Chlamydomonas_euryale.AAC.5
MPVCAPLCLQIFDHMVSRGFPPDAFTFGSLIEASVTAGQPELAHKIYLSALRQGFTHEAQIYTSALNACKLMGAPGLALALDIHSKMQNAGVMPDKKFYAALIAVSMHAWIPFRFPMQLARYRGDVFGIARCRQGAAHGPGAGDLAGRGRKRCAVDVDAGKRPYVCGPGRFEAHAPHLRLVCFAWRVSTGEQTVLAASIA